MFFTKIEDNVESILELTLKTGFAIIDKFVDAVQQLVPEQLVDEMLYLIDSIRRRITSHVDTDILDEFVYRSEAKIGAFEEIKSSIPAENTNLQNTIKAKIEALNSVIDTVKVSQAAKVATDLSSSEPSKKKKKIDPTDFLFPESRKQKTSRTKRKAFREIPDSILHNIIGQAEKTHRIDEAKIRTEETLATLKEMRDQVDPKIQKEIDLKINAYENILKQMHR